MSPTDPFASPPAKPLIDVRTLRHPHELSRFGLAVASSTIVLACLLIVSTRLFGPLSLLAAAIVIGFVVLNVWWIVQVHRSALLGRAAQVTAHNFPVLWTAAAEIMAELGYRGRVSVFVVDKAESPASLTSMFRTHIILLEGELAFDLSAPEQRPQLRFLLGTCIGALKTRKLRWSLALAVVGAVSSVKLLNFLIAPWHRACVYSGDQIGARCCGSFDEAVLALNRMMVGKHLASSIDPTSVLNQAVHVRRRWLPRFQQLYAAQPHLTNRYLSRPTSSAR